MRFFRISKAARKTSMVCHSFMHDAKAIQGRAVMDCALSWVYFLGDIATTTLFVYDLYLTCHRINIAGLNATAFLKCFIERTPMSIAFCKHFLNGFLMDFE